MLKSHFYAKFKLILIRFEYIKYIFIVINMQKL